MVGRSFNMHTIITTLYGYEYEFAIFLAQA